MANYKTRRSSINLNDSNLSHRNDTVMKFLADIREYSVLSVEEEAEFFYDYMVTDDPREKLEKKQNFLSRNIRLLYAFAKRYEKNPSKVLDLVDQAFIGMDIAFDRFDVTRGNRFNTYAAEYIRREITEYIYKVQPSIVPSNVNKIAVKVPKIKEKFLAENHREPTTDEIIDILEGEYNTQVVNVADVFDAKTFSINAKCGDGADDDMTFEDHGDFALATSNDNDVVGVIESDSLKAAVHSAMSVLNEKERKVITMLFGLEGEEEMSPDTVAMMLDLSTTRILQIRAKALDKLSRMRKVLLSA